ncbi:MAG: hypothetical protein MJ149_02885, partial [Clostridia bacterium]|nr:hypothetical protein [Clostridia bacterium]
MFGGDKKSEDTLLFIEVDGARFYAPLKNIFYYDGIDEITLSKTPLKKLDEILKKDLFYQDANGKHKITALDETKSYQVDVKKDEKCTLERAVGVDKGKPVVKTYTYTVEKEELGERLKTARKGRSEAEVCAHFAAKGVTTMTTTRLKEIEEGKAKEPLTAEEEKVFIEYYELKNKEEFFNEFLAIEKEGTERKLDAKVVTQKVVENPDMTINVRETTNGVATTVKAEDVYLIDKDGNRETESLAKVLEGKRAGSLVGRKAQLKVGNKFVDLQPLSMADVNTINNVGKTLQISEYSYSKIGKYIKVTLAISKQEQLVEITKLWDGDKQLSTAEDLKLYVGKTLICKEKREDAGVAIAPLTAEQVLMTYVGAEPHMEEVADEYVETEETRYLLTQDGNFVDEKTVSPISYDKWDNETTCDAFLVTNKAGERVVVTKKDMDSLTVSRSDLYKDIEPLKLSTYDLIHAYVIQTSNSALDGIEHRCSVVGEIKKTEDKEKAITEAEAQFLALYKHNLYDVDFVVQRQHKKAPHCYKKIGKAVNADAIMVEKGTETFIISKEKYDSMSHASRSKYSKIVPLELLPDGDLEHADVIQTSRKRGEEFHSCVDVSMHSATKGTKRVKAVNSAVEAFTKALSEGNYNFDVETKGVIVELDPRHKRYAE